MGASLGSAVAIVATVSLLACAPAVVSSDGDGGADDDDEGEPDGPPSAGESGGDPNPYDECAVDYYFGPMFSCSEGAFGGTAADACSACICGIACSVDSDCPQPSTGTVGAACVEEACLLPCDETSACPEGMRCGTRNWDGRATCVETVDDPLACHYTLFDPDWPDPCTPQLDRDSCEALVSKYGFACKWATQTVLQGTSDDCAPLEVVESCVLTQATAHELSPPTCGAVGYCEASATRVLFEDFGGGSMRLTSIGACELMPIYSNLAMGFQFCSFDETPPMPAKCACGCP